MLLSCINYRSQTVRSVSNFILIVVSIEGPCRRGDLFVVRKVGGRNHILIRMKHHVHQSSCSVCFFNC